MEDVIEIFGKRLKIVTDVDDYNSFCEQCAVKVYCWDTISDKPLCANAEGKMSRHFEEVID